MLPPQDLPNLTPPQKRSHDTASLSIALVKSSSFWQGLALMSTLMLFGLLLNRLDHDTLTLWINTQIRDQGIQGEIFFIGIGAVLTAIGLPRQVLSFFGGYAFDFFLGTLLSLLATLIGAGLTFHSARLMGRKFLIRYFPNYLKILDNFLTHHAFSLIIALRLAPFTSNLITNLAGGVSGIRPLSFFVGSALGYLPQTLIFALLGSGFHLDPTLRTSLSVILFVISSVLGIWIGRRAYSGSSTVFQETR